jgi:hypothetical protein
LLSVYGILMLVDSGRLQNDLAGYTLLVVGPLIMLSARWIDPPSESLDSGDGEGDPANAATLNSEAPSSPAAEKSD